MQAAIDRAAPIGTVDDCAVVDQQFHKWELHAGVFRMPARRRQSERCRTSPISVRLGVYIGAGLQQQLRNLDNVLRRLLAEVLDAVCRDIMEQGRAMLTSRTR